MPTTADRRDETDPAAERERERRTIRAHAAAAAMMGLRAEDRPNFVSSFRDCRTPEFVELMIGLARDVRATWPQEAAARVRLGLVALDSGLDCDREQLAISRAAALGELGNAYRLTGDLERAATTLDEASRAITGINDPDLALEIQGMRAQTIELPDGPNSINSHCKSALANSHATSNQSLAFFHLSIASAVGRFAELSFFHLETALNLLDPKREPRLLGVAFGGLGQSLLRMGHINDGLGFLRRSLAVLNRWGTSMDRIRVLWLAAKADQRRGGWLSAEQKLQHVAFCLTHLGQPLPTGLAFLDLSRTFAQTGGWLQAESEALKAAAIFKECRSERLLAAAEQTLTHSGSGRRRSASRIDEIVEDLW